MEVVMRRACLILFAIMMVLSFVYLHSLEAMPPHPDRAEEMRVMKLFGEDVPDYRAMSAEWAERGINQPSDFNLAPLLTASDTFKILAIIIEFPDKAAQTTATYFDTLIYANQQGTVRHYYLENSYGTLDMTTITLPSGMGWLTSPQNANYYTSGGDYGLGTYPNNAQKLVEDAVDLADSYVNYSDYDNDNNGWVDGLMVVHAGRGAEYTMNVNDIWSHKWGISPRYRDTKYISTYSMMPEYWVTPGDMTCGVYVHELGHVLGLPDLYDTDYSSNGVGKWSVMSAGSWNGVNGNSPSHFDAWSKIQLGFAAATNVAATTMGASIPEVENNATIYRLWTSGTFGNEYFLAENRQQTGYDSALPGEGLLIWHIDDGVETDNDNEWYPPDHTSGGHYLVALEQADGLWQIEKSASQGNTGDPYPGDSINRAFSPLTTPNSNSYSGDNTLVAISNISDSGPTMTADFTVTFASPAEDEIDDVLPLAFELDQNCPNPFNNETQISFSLAEGSQIDLKVYNILGQSISTLISDYYEAGTYHIAWDGSDSDGNEVSTGVYFYRLTTNAESYSRKMLLLK
jgi:immune inhibitor A